MLDDTCIMVLAPSSGPIYLDVVDNCKGKILILRSIKLLTLPVFLSMKNINPIDFKF